MFLRLLEPLTHASFTGELITFHGGLLKTQLELSSWAPGQTALSNLLYFTPLSTHCFSSITALWGALLLGTCSQLDGASLLLPVVKKKILLPMQDTQETQVWSLGWKDPLEEEMATHSSIFAWRIPWTEEPGRLQCNEGHQWLTLSLFKYN